MSKPLRRIGEPVVAAAPAGVRIRTRIRPSAQEAAALTAIGELLGSLYRGELAERIRLGRMDHKAHAVWRAQRKQALTAASSSRWAGNACGATATTSTPPPRASSSGGTAGRQRGCF